MEIVARKDWGARPAEGSAADRKIVLPAPRLWIHHTGAEPQNNEAAEMRAIQDYHIRRATSKGWNTRDIAYSFLIFPSGNIYEGRGWGKYGNHTQNENTTSHAVCFAGDYRTTSPTLKSLDAARWLIAFGKQKGFIASAGTHPTGGHRDVVSTACPGGRLYDRLDYLRQPWKEEMTPEQMQELKAYIDGKINGPTGAVAQIKAHLESHSGASGTGLTAAQVKEAAKQAAREGTGA